MNKEQLIKQAEEVTYLSSTYWRLRCTYLEKSIYPKKEEASEEENKLNFDLWLILKNRTK